MTKQTYGRGAAPGAGQAVAAPLLHVRDLVQEFTVKGGRPFQRDRVSAVAGVGFTIARGETLALVGETGSGKSTIARALLASPPALSGSITLNGRSLPVGRHAKPAGTGQARHPDGVPGSVRRA